MTGTALLIAVAVAIVALAVALLVIVRRILGTQSRRKHAERRIERDAINQALFGKEDDDRH